MDPKVHTFDSTGQAYDASQCDDAIKDGDVLHVPSEHVTGVLVEAWPVAVTAERGEFHTSETLTTMEDGKYAASAALAERTASGE